MPLTSTAYCGRTVRRHVFTPCQSIWISDTVLVSAFERYCAVSRITVRHGSSVPGPLENRRRLGKRRMGELSSGQSQAGVPFWELANTVDLTQWKWQPATLPNTRQHQQDSPSSSPSSPSSSSNSSPSRRHTFREMIPAWFSTSSPNLTEGSRHRQDALPGIPTPPEASTPTWDAHTGPQAIVDQGLNLLGQDLRLASTMSTMPNFSRFCSTLNQSLSKGWFSDESICFISRHVREGLVYALEGFGEDQRQRRLDDLRLQLIEAMLDGLVARRSNANGNRRFESLAWNDLLLGTAQLQRNSLRIFSKVMGQIPDYRLNTVSSGILANIETYFTVMGKGGRKRRDTLSRQAGKLASALRKLDTDHNPEMLADATMKVLDYMESAPSSYVQVRASWLHALVRMPKMHRRYFTRICAILEAAPHVEPLTKMEIGRLFLAQYYRLEDSNLDYVNLLYHCLNRTDPNNPECYPDMCALFWHKGRLQHIILLCRLLEDLGRTQDIFHLLNGFRNVVKNHSSPLSNLALGADNPLVAFKISSIYASSIKRGIAKRRRGNFWKSSAAAQAMKALVHTHYVRPHKLFSALGLFAKRRELVEFHRRAGERAITKLQIEKVSTLAEVLTTAPYLTNRTSFRLITGCIHYLYYHNAPLPSRVIRALIHNVTRSLAHGEFGRQMRLEWTTRQAARFAGPEAAEKLRSSLERWRIQNFGHRP